MKFGVVLFLLCSLCCVSPLHTSFCHYCITGIIPVEIHNGKVRSQDIETLPIDEITKQPSQQEVPYDFIASSVAKFIRDKKVTKRKLPIGFVVSFPVKQENLTSGKLIHWTRDFKAEGEDVVQLLKAAFDREVHVGIQ